MDYQYNDGGRAEAGYKGETRDCVVRAIAIATEKPYQEVYDAINILSSKEKIGTHKKIKSNARTGVHRFTCDNYLKSLGWKWTPTMLIGQGCKVHLKPSELPAKRLVVKVSKHMVAVINGIVHDTHDPSRNETRCVYGYWSKVI